MIGHKYSKVISPNLQANMKLSFLCFILFPLSILAQQGPHKVCRDSLVGTFAMYPTDNTGRVHLRADSTCSIINIPDCPSCLALEFCGIWEIKGRKVIIKSFPQDTLLNSEFTGDTSITIWNTGPSSYGWIQTFLNDGTAPLHSLPKNGFIKIPKANLDSIQIAPLALLKTIYPNGHDFYEFKIYPRCMIDNPSRHEYKIHPNYTLKGRLSRQKVTLKKQPD